MIGYVTLGTNNIEKAVSFYDALLTDLGAKRYMEDERFVIWSAGPSRPAIMVTKPYNGEAATVGNGSMTALVVDSPEKVDHIYKKALELGGTDEGAPGPRKGSFYVAYFRDLDGNKLNVFCYTRPQA